jgi:autotransporter translocation and assembly factor TamB
VRKPALQLTSSPSLEESDILSLLVFNVPANELAANEREQLALRAASLAVGYVATPAISAIGQRLGLDFLQVEQTGNVSSGLRVSAGREIFRNLFLTYAHEFGAFEYNEFLMEYELSRYLHIHANASDARGVRSRASLFRRVETAGIDLIFFFSY